MARKLFRILQTAYEGITQLKLNRAGMSGWNSAATALFGIFPTTSSFWIGGGGKATAGGALNVTLAKGLGIHFLVGSDWDHDFRPIIIDSDVTIPFEGNSDASGNDRIDLLCMRAVDSEGDSISVETKDPTSGVISETTLNQRVEYDWEYQIVKGTVAASPVAPATPANWIAVAEVTIPNAAVALIDANIEDVRDTALSIFNDLRPTFLRPKEVESYGETIRGCALFSHPGGSPSAPYDFTIEAGRGIASITYEGGASKAISVTFEAGYRPRSASYAVLVTGGHVDGATPQGRFVATPLDAGSCYLQYIDAAGALAEPPALAAGTLGKHSIAIVDLTSV